MSVTKVWSRHLVPLFMQIIPEGQLKQIRGSGSWDECLVLLLNLGAIYLDQIRMRQEFLLDSNNVLRIHLMPKRYPIKSFYLGQAIEAESQDYIIINKPALVPVHPTVDNFKENILFILNEIYKENIFCVHRLDVETTGLIMFVKNKPAQAHYLKLFSEKKIKKFYKAIVAGKGPPSGCYSHWMEKSKRAPKHITDTEQPGAALVELKILDRSDFQGDESSCLDIELLTGKTHQIRSQLSHLGFPLLGDSVYGGGPFPKGLLYSHFLLHSSRIEFCDQGGQLQNIELSPRW